ncbi:MAG TPA: hypothetical protein VMB84_16730 [Stellaceae bacterium]|nr:hypothetical protein [Stellaceae bacterium]
MIGNDELLTLLVPWNLASYLPFGGFDAGMRDWLLAQTGAGLLRPPWPHESDDDADYSGPPPSRRDTAFDRLAELHSIASFVDLADIDIIERTPGHLEFHRGLPLATTERPYIILAEAASDLFAPFLVDDSAARRGELETALAIYHEMLASESCRGILGGSHATRAELTRLFPGDTVAAKLFEVPQVMRATEAGERRRGSAPVFAHIGRPPRCDGFGRVSELAAFDAWCDGMLVVAAFTRILEAQPDARLIWLCPDWRQDPRRGPAAAGLRLAGDLAARREGQLAALLASRSLLVLAERPGEAELRRLLRRADFLIDFSIRPDAFVVRSAMQQGCIPILGDAPGASELAGEGSGFSVELGRDCYRWNPLGFVEGYSPSPQALDRASQLLTERLAPALETIADRTSTARMSAAVTEESARRYCRYDLDSYLQSTVLREFALADEAARDGAAWPIGEADFTLWPEPVLEHRLEGLELIAAGSSVHCRSSTGDSASLSRPPSTGWAAPRFDALVQHFADLEIVAHKPSFAEPSAVPGLSAAVPFEGTIDRINGGPVAEAIRVEDLLRLTGWTAISGKDGLVPEEVFVTLRAHGGQIALIPTRRMRRMDLVAHFGQPALREAGFTTAIDLTGQPDGLVLGLARKSAGRVELCANLSVLLYRRASPADPFDAAAAALPQRTVQKYEAVIDSLNGRHPDLHGNAVSGRLTLRGWMTLSGAAGTVPEAVFVRIDDRLGQSRYVRARRTNRDDVREFFGQPSLNDAGFVAHVDTRELDGDYTIGLARIDRGYLETCAGLSIPVTIRNSRYAVAARRSAGAGGHVHHVGVEV